MEDILSWPWLFNRQNAQIICVWTNLHNYVIIENNLNCLDIPDFDFEDIGIQCLELDRLIPVENNGNLPIPLEVQPVWSDFRRSIIVCDPEEWDMSRPQYNLIRNA